MQCYTSLLLNTGWSDHLEAGTTGCSEGLPGDVVCLYCKHAYDVFQQSDCLSVASHHSRGVLPSVMTLPVPCTCAVATSNWLRRDRVGHGICKLARSWHRPVERRAPETPLPPRLRTRVGVPLRSSSRSKGWFSIAPPGPQGSLSRVKGVCPPPAVACHGELASRPLIRGDTPRTAPGRNLSRSMQHLYALLTRRTLPRTP